MKPKLTALDVLKRMAAEHRRMAAFYQGNVDDPHNISTALYVMHLDSAAAIEKSLNLPVRAAKRKL